MGLVIRGLGTARPEYSIEQHTAAKVARTFVFGEEQQTRALPALFRRTQVRRRGSVLLEPPNGDEIRQSFYPPAIAPEDRGPATALRMERYAREAPRLAVAASRRALVTSGVRPGELTHLVTISCTGFSAPGIDIALVKGLCLAPTVGRVHVGFMGCHGVLNGLRAAEAFVEADPGARVLLCAVELCSLHYQYGLNPQAVVANALFADGAAALVAGPSENEQRDQWRLVACGSLLIPDAEEEMTWQIGNHGFEMTLSPRVPELIERHLRAWLEPWLRSCGHALESIGSWAIHPGGPRILSSVVTALTLPPGAIDASAQILAECGNMSSPTVLFVLERLQQISAPRPCVALAFGPGLIAEAALFV